MTISSRRRAAMFQRYVSYARVTGLLCGIALSINGGPEAMATETPLPITPAGGTDIGQALLPPPGLYGGVAALPLNENHRFNDADGNVLDDSQTIKTSIPIIAAGLIYSYPGKILGGNVISSIQVPFFQLDYRIGSGPRSRQRAMGDIYVDLFQWAKKVSGSDTASPLAPLRGLTVSVGLAAKAPTGSYSKDRLLNIGSNVWLAVPNIAMTYRSGPLGGVGNDSELSARAFYGIPTKNKATGYQSGQVLAVDFAATQGLGAWRVGLAGTFGQQTSNDIAADGSIPPNGNKSTNLYLGPVVSFTPPRSPFMIKLKHFSAVHIRNSTKQEVLSLVVGYKF